MTEPQHGPEEGAEAVPAKKAAPKKAPAKAAKKAPAKKAPAKAAKKAPAKTAVKKAVKKALPPAPPRPPQLALEPGHEAPALEAAPTHAALNPGTSGTPTAKPATAPPRSPEGGRARLPLSIGLAALGLVAVVLSRFRRG